jgi:hypothetical protein
MSYNLNDNRGVNGTNTYISTVKRKSMSVGYSIVICLCITTKYYNSLKRNDRDNQLDFYCPRVNYKDRKFINLTPGRRTFARSAAGSYRVPCCRRCQGLCCIGRCRGT